MSFIALAGAIGAGATALGASAGVASVIGAVGAGAIGGAGLGALSSAVTGGDVGKGALFGALGGGLTGGLGSAVGAMGGSAAGSTAGAGAAGSAGAGISTTAGGVAQAAGAAPLLNPMFGQLPTAASSALPAASSAIPAASSVVPAASAIPAGIPAPYTPPTLPMSPIPAGAPAGTAASAIPAGIPAPYTPPTLPMSPLGTGTALAQTSYPLPAGMESLGHLTQADINNAALQNSYFGQHPISTILQGLSLGNIFAGAGSNPTQATPAGYEDWNPLSYYKYNPKKYRANRPFYIKPANYADGGIASLNPDRAMMQSGPAQVDFMGEDAYPMSQQKLHFYSTPTQMPTSAQQAMASYEPSTNPLTGEPIAHFAEGGLLEPLLRNDPLGMFLMQNRPSSPAPDPLRKYLFGDMIPGFAQGGIAEIPVGGKLLSGDGDGVSDDIRANIEGRQEARLADGEYVVPARAVSELGNGSTDAGAKKLSAMVDRIQQGRKKSMKRKNIAVDSKAHRAMPA